MADGDPAPSHEFSREMGLSHAEFFKSLPAAIGHREYVRDGERVRVDLDGGRRVVFELSPQRERVIALLRLPVTDVRFRFHGFDDESQAAFMRHFELRFQRGGG